ncbi:MAG: small ribosomal subunit Rsm22 family protein, partial [Halobacteriovoraceae bacterium]|nr:small ribosomal subunit Rsm22 family protein [Halobacteriovoraceae bacterium]
QTQPGTFWLETMTTYSQLKKYLLKPNLPDRTLAKHINTIKELYTIRRDGLDEKLWSEEEVSSYASFYLPTNQEKFSFVMDQVSESMRDELASCQVIDFGTGPGTYLLAFLDRFGGSDCGHLYGIDINPIMIDQAEKLLFGLYPEFKTKIHFEEEVGNYSEGRGKLLIFGNSLNEMSHESVYKVIQTVRPDHLLFIEPGVPTVFDEIVKIRELLKKDGYSCHFPCPNMEPCPLVKEEMVETDWCHQVWRGTHEPQVEHLAQLAKIDRRTMPFIGHLYSKSPCQKDTSARFIRFIHETKHSFVWEVCRSLVDESLQKVTFEIPKRILSKSEMKELKRVSVGMNFSYEVEKVLGNGKFRLKSLALG